MLHKIGAIGGASAYSYSLQSTYTKRCTTGFPSKVHVDVHDLAQPWGLPQGETTFVIDCTIQSSRFEDSLKNVTISISQVSWLFTW